MVEFVIHDMPPYRDASGRLIKPSDTPDVWFVVQLLRQIFGDAATVNQPKKILWQKQVLRGMNDARRN